MTGAWLAITDARTGETRRYRDDMFDSYPESGSEFLWSEGNFSCDCNRALFFAWAGGDADPPDRPCGQAVFHIPRAECDDGQIIEIDGEMTS